MKKDRELYMYIVGGAIAILFVALTIYLNVIKSADIAAYNETFKNIVVLIIGYYWGSSQGSTDKTDMMNKP